MEQASRHLGPKDAGALKALSHPLRMRLLLTVDEIGPATVGMLAEHLTQPVGVISYHLRQLARHGLVAEVPELARDRRERWWRFVPTEDLSLTPSEFADDPVGLIASRATMLQWVEFTAEQTRRWVEDMHAWPREWQDAALLSRLGQMRLTSEELRRFGKELNELVERWQAHGENAADDSPDRRRVALYCHAQPLGPPPGRSPTA
ncbi:helix-turn-helix domain-containing protein [Streptosporangium carneum]|uniref:Transcriptional regulator n=1 Tax=Streptosporangium carneum TaxID=47481 RepID=A0A9W6I7T9_9ACTN|nr:helix-turn-helix domain-containing protein [Streptosporangium carneum]GLK12560.1 transcriptional regulator [Streptosporangium carneum]